MDKFSKAKSGASRSKSSKSKLMELETFGKLHDSTLPNVTDQNQIIRKNRLVLNFALSAACLEHISILVKTRLAQGSIKPYVL